MKLTFATVPLGTLILSPLNARPRDLKAEDVDDLIPSIRALGLANPLTVHVLKKPKGKHGVVAGQRRWRALLELASDPAIDAAAIPVMIAEGTDAELRELSIHENEQREEMDEVELLLSMKALRKADPKLTDEQVAVNLGVDTVDVRRIMKIANLHADILNAYRQDHMSGEMARAYAASDDQDEQLRAFKHIAGLNSYDRTVHAVRRFYGFGVGYDVETQLEIVGSEVFMAAGGKIEEDLFSTARRVIGVEQLAELFREKARTMVAEYQAAHPNVTFVASDDLPRGEYGGVDWQLRIEDSGTRPPEDAAALANAEADRDRLMDALTAMVDEAAMTPDHEWPGEAADFTNLPWKDGNEEARDEALTQLRQAEATIVAIEAKDLVMPTVPLLGTYSLRKSGLDVTLYWPSREAAGLPAIAKKHASMAAAAKAEVQEANGGKLTARADQVLKAMRVNMLTAYVRDTDIDREGLTVKDAHRALIFNLARETVKRGVSSTGMESYGSPFFGQDLGPIAPPMSWTMAEWAEGSDLQGWASFSGLSDQEVDEIAAYVWARRVTGATMPNSPRGVFDDIGTVLAVPSMARRYLDLDDKFFAMFSKAQILGFIEEACTAPSPVTGKPMEMSATLKGKLNKYKLKDLQSTAVLLFRGEAQALKLLAATPHREGLANWVPSWLRWHDREAVSAVMHARAKEQPKTLAQAFADTAASRSDAAQPEECVA